MQTASIQPVVNGLRKTQLFVVFVVVTYILIIAKSYPHVIKSKC